MKRWQPKGGNPAKMGGELCCVFLSLEFNDHFKPPKRELKVKCTHRVFARLSHSAPLKSCLPPFRGGFILTKTPLISNIIQGTCRV
ncbi:hypothetical protein HBZC1_17590 [Helicobacter bizzozeronii CIII-1]|uniref:Uncharacterized protein n=1 Tax=Helicobacter bizzozeronii (strain CIII-1) TaxID=1002804 RepID=F8KPM0_HELBC|nr:hypothetical protein HBZC1_17590 [Helicobacter bizzozeronii CIII-1]